ncbi:MAG TPA: hypothetical protein VG319_10805, partial [Polyangia bacterium]|nr:hypothetical protein [Polyangia bacterium]
MSFFPSPWRARGWAVLAASLAAAAMLGGAGCYNPSIATGSFKCNTGYKAGSGDCPDGFHCSDGFCIKGTPTLVEPQPDVAPEAQPDVAAETKPDVTPDLLSEPAPCNLPVTGCAPASSGKCDPVCQTGCTGCHEKCASNTAGTLTCNVPLDTRARGLGENCDIASKDQAAQTDNCAPGLVCLDDACGSRCYHYCKSDADCPMSTCTHDAGGGIKTCDVQAVTCNPIKNMMPTDCPLAAQGCYLSSTVTDRTVCDCPFQAGG